MGNGHRHCSPNILVGHSSLRYILASIQPWMLSLVLRTSDPCRLSIKRSAWPLPRQASRTIASANGREPALLPLVLVLLALGEDPRAFASFERRRAPPICA